MMAKTVDAHVRNYEAHAMVTSDRHVVRYVLS
jgi:hypothetical protein